MTNGVVTDPELIGQLNSLRNSNLPSVGTEQQSMVTDPSVIEQLELRRQASQSQSSALQAVSSVTPEQWQSPSTPIDKLFGTLETAATIVSSIIAEPVAGIVGGVVGITDRDLGAAVDTIESVRAAMTFNPRGQEGQRQLEAVGSTLEPIGEAIVGTSESLGDFGYRTTGSPEVAAALYSLPTMALELIGLKGARTASRLTPDATHVRNMQRTLLNDTTVGRYSGDVAEVTLNRTGQVVPDPIGQTLVDLGMPRNHVAVITNSSPASRKIMANMLDKFEKGKTNNIAALSSRMTDDIGQSLTRRLTSLQSSRRSLGNRLDFLVNNQLKGQTIQVNAPLGEFVRNLADDFDIKPRISGDSTVSFDMNSGVIGTRGMSGTRSLINDTLDVMNQSQANGVIDVSAAHKLKKGLDEMIDAAKASEAGITGRTHSRLLELRSGINQALGDSFEQYRGINTELSQIIDTMKPFDKYKGVGQAWSDTKVSNVVGSALDNLGGDAGSARALSYDVHRLEQLMRERGAGFADDTSALIDFKQGIEDFFKLNEETIVRESKNLSTPAARKVLDAAASGAVQNTFGLTHDVSSLVALGMQRADAAKYLKDLNKAKTTIKRALNNQYIFPTPRRATGVERAGAVIGGAAASSAIASEE
jgi:hypothetical protein